MNVAWNVCVRVRVCLSHAFPALSSHKLLRFLSVVSLAGVCNIFLICCSTLAQRSRESMPLLSTSVGVNVWIAPTDNSFSGVWVCVRACVCAQVQDCLCLSFMFNPSFMQSDLSHRAPSVQPEGWISNALLKPLLGSLHTHAGSHSYKYTLKESRCVSDC